MYAIGDAEVAAIVAEHARYLRGIDNLRGIVNLRGIDNLLHQVRAVRSAVPIRRPRGRPPVDVATLPPFSAGISRGAVTSGAPRAIVLPSAPLPRCLANGVLP